MLASLQAVDLVDERFAYEPKYDGIRTVAEIERGGGPGAVRLWSRLGNDKTTQFPEIVRALQAFSRNLKASVVLDGEIVALDEHGEPAGFQHLQGRIHLTGERAISGRERSHPVAFVAFDALRDGKEDLRGLPLVARRARLERIIGNNVGPALRLSDFVPGDARPLHRRAAAQGWEGLVAKRLESRYASGRRSADWRKIKLTERQECVVGGWTEGRGTREHFGALILGLWDGDGLTYVGHTGTGFDGRELARVAALLREREVAECPFRRRPPANERPHWVRPDLVAEVAFSEWTADGKLRHPRYLGLRDDVNPRDCCVRPRRAFARAAAPDAARARPRRPADAAPAPRGLAPALTRLHERLAEIEAGGGEGVLALPDGARLSVGHLDKVYWPAAGITKGELMRYYVAVADMLLPAVADRPLIMRRFPDGVRAKAFYQQRAPDGAPEGVRVESLPVDREVPSRLIGGSLATLLYMTQIGVISQDPWFSRVGALDDADHVAFDLDPMPGVTFATVLDVARRIHDELERLGTPAVAKTSGSEGLHIYVPLPPGTSYEAGRLFCEIIATLVAERHPRIATVERSVHARGRTVYIDYLQNIRGKTLATAYSARASQWAGVSTPLTWREVHAGVDRRDFTLRTVLPRLAAVGDLWAALRESPGADLAAVLRVAGPQRPRAAARTRARRFARRAT